MDERLSSYHFLFFLVSALDRKPYGSAITSVTWKLWHLPWSISSNTRSNIPYAYLISTGIQKTAWRCTESDLVFFFFSFFNLFSFSTTTTTTTTTSKRRLSRTYHYITILSSSTTKESNHGICGIEGAASWSLWHCIVMHVMTWCFILPHLQDADRISQQEYEDLVLKLHEIEVRCVLVCLFCSKLGWLLERETHRQQQQRCSGYAGCQVWRIQA